jgi:acetoin utilization protein AcuB
MLAGELINQAIPSLKLSDTVRKALDRMSEFRLKQLPLVNSHQFLGLVSEENLLELPDHTLTFQTLQTTLDKHFVQDNQHAYEAIKLFYEQKLNAIAVINAEKKYLGLITAESMISGLATLTSAHVPGSILVLEISNRDNSLAHIAQIVESDHAEILSSYVRTFPDSTRMEITLKLNRNDVGSIVSAFQRYNYTILRVFNDAKLDEDNSDRYDQLMNYLNL